MAFESVSFFPKRSLGGFTANVTVREAHADRLTITRHPVEQGAAITDHAYKEPAQVIVEAGWSNSSVQAGGDPGYVDDIYEALLDLQSSREPFLIVTGRRRYPNMLFESIATETDAARAHTLFLTATCVEIILVQTQTASVPPAENQATPEKTQAPEEGGSKQLSPAPQANSSALATLAGE